MKTFIQYILIMLALTNVGLGQKPCDMKIKLVRDNAPQSPIANQEFTLKFYKPGTPNVLVKTIECGPTDDFGETVVKIDMGLYYRCILSLPEKSGFINSEFNYTKCVSEQKFLLSQRPTPPVDQKVLAKLRAIKIALTNARRKIKHIEGENEQMKEKIDSLIRVIDEDLGRAKGIISDLEEGKKISDEKLKDIQKLLDNETEKNIVLESILTTYRKMGIRLLDFACLKFEDRNSFSFSLRLSNYDYTIDTETKPTAHTFKVNLFALTKKPGPDGSRRRPIKCSNNSFDMPLPIQYPMKASDKAATVNFVVHRDDINLLNRDNDFEIEIFEYETNSSLGKASIPNTDLCVSPVDPEQPNIIGVLQTDCQKVTFKIEDAGKVDGDVINLNWVGNPNILENFTLTDTPHYQEVILSEGPNHFELEGVSPGTFPSEVSAKVQCYCGNKNGKLLSFQIGKMKKMENFIALFNQIVSYQGKIKNTSKKGFIINYVPR
ncbi:hypothetical protein VB264_15220 [Arcicella aquatica]|uniref:Uncharacterized protein n=1 Tax=Arcicella aquatica TaxID=217141 RepID=A0ABU5QRY1_9BACT|nr:hypothetical protein [Arcicella aquatica]MEA5259146.1 hypothetical protein [Arcicella aquatica]